MSERLRSVVEHLDIRRDDRVLEIGCGYGVAVFAVRVGLFHREPDRAHSLVERWLALGGVVFAFFDPPSDRRVGP